MSSKILYLSRIYPNNVIGTNGLWVEGLVRTMAGLHDVRVIAPVPYSPPLPSSSGYAEYRKILSNQQINNVEIYRPRFPSPPGYWLHSYLGEILYWSIVKKVDRYRDKFPFDLIHAHFSYPDGYVGARLARRYNVPLVITEHAAWIPWMDEYPRVRKQAVWATQVSAGVIAGSRYLRDTIAHFNVEPDKLNLIPIGVDTELFKPDSSVEKNRNQIIYVGRIHKTKGVDILLDAFASLVKSRPGVKLLIVGGSLGFRNYLMQEQEFRQKAHDRGLDPFIEYTGMQPQEKVAALIRSSAVLVLPSRRESFGSVLAESIACGTPVVATRCGGPEDIVNDDVGVLVEREDAAALAEGLATVLDKNNSYDPDVLHSIADSKYSWNHVVELTNSLYDRALAQNKIK